MNCRRAPAGLVSGPSRLKAVRTPSSLRVAPACFIDGCHMGAKKNREVGLLEGRHNAIGRRVELDAERFEHVRRSGSARHGAIAVLRHPHTCSSQDDCGGGRHIEGVRAVASGAARIEDISHRLAAVGVARARIVRANPTISAGRSPLSASAMSSAAMCAGWASPFMMRAMAPSASAAVRSS